MRLGVCNLRRTARYTAPTPLFNSVWWIARPRTVSALKTPHTSPPCHPFVGVSSVIFPILFFSLPLYGGATHQLARCFLMSALLPKADISEQFKNLARAGEVRQPLYVSFVTVGRELISSSR